ncbi:25_t:CDS:2 [Funneliformis geosporum]|uniref:18500_t:CDS:1 n=1 Tax=Funneliformis geosporum TaxID=1117311 RepID=A0A9W4SI43_9GLOM|nr:25_t:CDS:2 [Funneliformis geosporum]CAI2169343.1 18500_t:CDS:2 [Funneliformis geosporum]
MICDNDEPPFKKQRPGVAAVATNVIYKLTEIAAYTFGASSEIYNTITGGQGGKKEHSQQPTRNSYDYDQYYDDVLQIKTDEDEEENVLNNHEFDKKSHVWAENEEDEEEPPPPYESSWYMPSPSVTTETQQPTNPQSSAESQECETPEQPSNPQEIFAGLTTTSPPRRRQFRVRRGRRLLRRKSSSVDLTNSIKKSSSFTQLEDEDDIFLKFNCKLTDLIAEGQAALTSTVDVTEVEMMLAEERERDERIMKEFGIQTRRPRRLTGSSTSSDYDYYSSMLGSGGQSSTSLCDNGNGKNNYMPSTGHYADNGFSTNKPVIGHSQYGSSDGFHPSGGYTNEYGYIGGSSSTGGGPSTINRLSNSTASISSNSTTSSVYGSGPSNGFGPSLHNFGQNSSGYGSNSGFGSKGIYHSRRYY